MPRKRWLVLTFLLAFPVFLIAGLPASIAVSQLQGLQPMGQPLILRGASGTVWDGRSAVRWQGLNGQLAWRVQWQGLMPGVALELTGDARLKGWLGAGQDAYALNLESGRLPAHLLGKFSKFSAEGSLDVDGLQLRLENQILVEADGRLRYSGGQVGWPPRGSATMPPLEAILTPAPEGAALAVTGPEGEQLMAGSVRGNQGELAVYRAWPALLGVSRGGNNSDVVFQTSAPLW